MRFSVLVISALFLSLFACSCVTDPKSSAVELRSLFKEAQFQQEQMCKDPNVPHEKCLELKQKIDEAGPYIDAIEVAAELAANDPSQQLNFQALWATYKPKVESLLIRIVLSRYLGA